MSLTVSPPPEGCIRIRFVKSDDLISMAIRVDTLSKVSHTEAVLRDGTIIGAYPGGVARQPNDWDATSTDQMFVDVPCSAPTIEAWENWLVSKIGTPYDFAAITGLALHRDMHTEGTTICSALMIDGLRHLGIVDEKLFDADHQTTPHMLASALSMMSKMCYFRITPLQGS